MVIVEGKIVGKQRPRLGKYGTYTPTKTKQYEELIRREYKKQNGEFFEKGIPVKVIIYAYKKPCKSTTKKELRIIEQGLNKWTKKVDIDNITKSVLDSLNKVAYADDSQVTCLKVYKRYTLQQERIEIEVKEDK